jgi:hypothetical protein
MAQSDSRRRLLQLIQALPSEAESPASRLRLALKMQDAGIEMKRLSLQRQFPSDEPAEIRAKLITWLESQPPQPGLRDASYRFQ